MFDWDDLRIFLAVARARKVAPAARTLGIDATTVGRRIGRLAARIEDPLFETVAGERRLTERGQALFGHAETIERSALAALGEVAGDAARASGQVRLSLAEGFASWVLAPTLGDFHAAHPGIQLDLVTGSGFLNPSQREADIAVTLAAPRRGRLITARLGDYHLRLYAAHDYIARAGTPDRIDQLSGHPLIGYVPEFLNISELDYLGELGGGIEATIRSTSINVQHRLIAGGAGIGVLPAFIGDRDERLATVIPTTRIDRSFWIVMHRDTYRLARVAAVAAWLRRCTARLV